MKISIVTLGLALIASPVLAENSFSLSTGFDFSSGKYGGTTATDTLYIPVIGKYETGDFSFKLTVPYISTTGLGGVIRGKGRVARANKIKATTNAGLGDITAAAGYTIVDTDDFSLDVIGSVKFGTADSKKGLGTGANDYSAELDAYYMLGVSTLFLYAGHTAVGSMAGVTLRNTSYGSLGFSNPLGEKSSASLTLDGAQSASLSGTNSRELTFSLSHKIQPDLKITANLLKGLSAGSPDHGYGMMIKGVF